jgi:hypothetical protein
MVLITSKCPVHATCPNESNQPIYHGNFETSGFFSGWTGNFSTVPATAHGRFGLFSGLASECSEIWARPRLAILPPGHPEIFLGQLPHPGISWP